MAGGWAVYSLAVGLRSGIKNLLASDDQVLIVSKAEF